VKLSRVPTVASAVAVLATSSLAAPQTFESDVQVANEKVHVAISMGAFDYSAHQFRRTQHGNVLVDGVPAVGTDSFDPKTHVSSFRVDWNGHAIEVPKHLFEFVFNPSLEPKASSFDDRGSVLVLPGFSGSFILIHISGGDAAGSFNSWWVITKTGTVDRFVDGPP